MKKPKHTADYYREYWLKKFHNVTVKDVIDQHPEEAKNGEWFKLYPCTEEQYEVWKKWAITEAAKDNGVSLRTAQDTFWNIELDCAPYIK